MSFKLTRDSELDTLQLSKSLQIPISTTSDTPLKGRVIYNQTDNSPYYADGTSWHKILSGTDDTLEVNNLDVAGSLEVAGVSTLDGGILLDTVGGTADNLNYYEEATMTLPVSGAIVGNVVAYFVRVGRAVTLKISLFNSAVSVAGPTITVSNIPTRFKPDSPVNLPAAVRDNNIIVPGYVLFTDALPTPTAIFSKQDGSNFTTSPAGFEGLLLNYPQNDLL